MGKGGCTILMVLVSAAVVGLKMAGTAGAQMLSPSPAPSPGVDCSAAFVSAASCLDYVSEGSNLTSPGSGCCSGIKDLLNNSPVCLCQLVANSGSLGLAIDRKRALGLPNACKFSAPPLSTCSLLGVPIPGPSDAPSPAEKGGKAPMSSETPASFAPSPAAGSTSSPDCSAAEMSLVSCLDYITSGSNLTSPGSNCCSGIKNLITKEPVCLCQLQNNKAPPGISIDRKRALGLSDACKVTPLSPGYCSKLGSSLPPEALSSPADAASTPGGPTSAQGGSEPATVPSPGKSNSIRRFGFRPSVLLSNAMAMIVTCATIAIF